jgi:uncharacterized membrane protein
VTSVFDIRSVLLARHAQHVVLIHFPIALFLTGTFFDVLGKWRSDARLAAAAYFNLVAAALFVPPVLITGVLAWYFALGATRIKGLLLWHLVVALASSCLIVLTAFIHIRKWGSRQNSSLCLYIEGCAALLIAATAHLGGYLTGVNGG